MSRTASDATTPAAALAHARSRGFAGSVLDGIDVSTLIAASADAETLSRALDIAQRGDEKIWAERFARRLCECAPTTSRRLTLASILASAGNLAEARAALNAVPADLRNDEDCRRVAGVLHAKAGRVNEAMAAFDTLSGRRDPYYPDPIVPTAVQEMLSQCDPAQTLPLLHRLRERYPTHLLIRALTLRCHLYAGEIEAARELSRLDAAALAAGPPYERRAFVEAVAEIHDLMGRTNTLFDFVRDRIADDPSHWALYGLAANAAAATARDAEYNTIIDAIAPADRDSAAAMSILCRWHLDAFRIEPCAALIEKIRPQSASMFLAALLHLEMTRRDQNGIEAAFETFRRCGVPLLGAALAYSLHAYYYNCSTGMLHQSLAKLEAIAAAARNRAMFWQIYLRCLIGLDRADEAAEKYRAVPAGLANGALLKPFAMFFDARANRHEKARADWTRYLQSAHHSCVNARSSYPATVRLNYAETRGAVLLFATVFNGGDYLDWFLAHYRALGVDHFFVIDNGSTDGTRDRLLAEPDVSTFFNAGSFAVSRFGVLWINHLMQRFGIGHWCFHVDIDEGFVFPGCTAGRSLRDLLSYCDGRGFGLVRTTAVDMYPETLDATAATDPFAASCYYDVDYVEIPCEIPPYVVVQGGVRRRLTRLAAALQKAALIRMAPDVRYIECSHATTHLPVADVSGAVLHYKFVGDLKRRVGEAVARGEHASQAVFYRRFETSLGARGWQGSLLSPHSRRYDGPDGFVRHGLMSAGDWRP